MKIERGFLRSRVARRIVALFVLCALIPIAATAVLSYARVRELLLDQGSIELAHLNTGYATALYERLLVLQLLAREAADDTVERPTPQPPSDEARQHLRSYFDAIAVVVPTGTTTPLLGALRPFPALIASERERLAAGGTILKVDAGHGAASPVFIALAIDSHRPQSGLLVAEINRDYLWGDPSDVVAALTQVCVAGQGEGLLYCSEGEPPTAIRKFASRSAPAASGRFAFEHGGKAQQATYRELFLEARFLVSSWTVITTRPESEALAPIGTFKTLFIPAIGLSLLVVALLSVTQVRRTLVPLENLISGTRRAANKDFTTRVAVSGSDEFSELAASFNAMNARLGMQFTALATLAEIDRAILSRLDVDRVIETVMARIRDIVPADYVSIALLDRTAIGMMRVYTRSGDALSLERSACTEDEARELLAHADGLWLDAGDRPRPYAVPVSTLGAKAVFASPIVWKEAAVGAVVLGFREGTSLSADERVRVHDLGDRIGVAFAAAAKDEQLYYQAHYDALTELPNRLYFRDQLERTLAHAQRSGERLALLFVDLDYFKRVNDSLGHASGDAVLRDAAARIRDCVRGTDIVARLGGDEFTLLLSDVKTPRDPQIVAEHIIAAMSAPFVLDGHDHFLNASIGIALYPEDGATADDLLRNADTAMYRAKESGRGQCVYFERRMNADAVARVRSERELHHAIDRDEFVLRYQPQMDLQTGRISGAEALVRWNHPNRGLLEPMHFIDLAEETGLIRPLGEWVLREACTQFRTWQQTGSALPRLSVNVSPRQFQQKDFVAQLARIVRETEMPPSALEIEITESLLLDATRTTEMMLWDLKSVGVQIALDDFGTGYSSLAYLKRFPIDVVKIDRAFVKDLPADEGSAAITAAIIAMAHALHKQVTAEGVATAEQAAFLRRLHCDHMQGYYLSVPLPAPELVDLVRETLGDAETCTALQD